MRLALFDEYKNLLLKIRNGWESFIGGNPFNFEVVLCISERDWIFRSTFRAICHNLLRLVAVCTSGCRRGVYCR
jgi:hypothetical protein